MICSLNLLDICLLLSFYFILSISLLITDDSFHIMSCITTEVDQRTEYTRNILNGLMIKVKKKNLVPVGFITLKKCKYMPEQLRETHREYCWCIPLYLNQNIFFCKELIWRRYNKLMSPLFSRVRVLS